MTLKDQRCLQVKAGRQDGRLTFPLKDSVLWNAVACLHSSKQNAWELGQTTNTTPQHSTTTNSHPFTTSIGNDKKGDKVQHNERNVQADHFVWCSRLSVCIMMPVTGTSPV